MFVKKLLFFGLLIIGMVGVSFITPEKNCPDNWGSKKIYQPKDTAFVAPPAGYKAVLINHVTRHGARHLSSMKNLTALQQMLSEAATANALTENGVRLQAMINLLSGIETGRNVGLLTETGKAEQQGIGRRMERHYPDLIDNPSTLIKIITTKVERTKQSAAAFMQGLGRPAQTGGNVQRVAEDSVSLRFFEIAPAYLKFKKRLAEMNTLAGSPQAKEENKNILFRFFKNNYAAKLSLHIPDAKKPAASYGQEFINSIFDVAALPNALQTEIRAAGIMPENVDVRSLFTCEEWAWLEKSSSVEDFLLKGPGTDANGIQVRNAVPLLVALLNSSDSFLQTGRPAVILRFAHAETIAPLTALLGIKGMATSVRNIADFENVWNASQVMGYSNNLQWVFYKSSHPKKGILLKILYNEKPVEIPVATAQFPYYSWKDVKAYYLKKLAGLHVSSDDDMLAYLREVK